MPLLVGSIGLSFAYLALNLIIRSRLTLETEKEKRKLLGSKIIKLSYRFIPVGFVLLFFGLLRPDVLQTYILVGLNLILFGVNSIFLGKPLKEPDADHSTLGRNARLLAHFSKWLALGLMFIALVWAAWPILNSLVK